MIQNEHIGALSTLNNQSVCFGISPYNSNSMKSNNPHSGIYEADTSRTLDLNGGSPACNQGGMAVVQAAGVDAYNQSVTGDKSMTVTAKSTDAHHVPCVIEGNGSRPSHSGDGYSESETMYTLNSTEHHAVCFAEKASARCAQDGRGAVHSQMMANPEGNFVCEVNGGGAKNQQPLAKQVFF